MKTRLVCHYYKADRFCLYEKQAWSDVRQGWFAMKVFRTLLDVARAGLDVMNMEVCYNHE